MTPVREANGGVVVRALDYAVAWVEAWIVLIGEVMHNERRRLIEAPMLAVRPGADKDMRSVSGCRVGQVPIEQSDQPSHHRTDVLRGRS